jgi:hypothetical protein
MSNYDLHLVLDWTVTPFYGHFTTKTWVVTDGTNTTTISDFIAADLKQNDTMTFSLQEANPTPSRILNLKQFTIIFTKELGAGSEPDTPFSWTDGNSTTPILLGMVVFTPNDQSAGTLPLTQIGVYSANFTSYPPTPSGGTLLSVTNNATAAFEATLCAEIWDNSDPTVKRFYTHDPSMDVTTTD